ncbi:MAG: flagellar export chaperone FliS [Spirochaetaceae bacterium]|nr:flagellar export chaperone FliS [Spirochaetaceae bacterium]
MAYNAAFNAYKQTGVKTATQGKLLIMLYDEAIKQLGSALSWFNKDEKLDPNTIEKFNNNIIKTQQVITELMVSLDMDKGGDIAKNLLALYVYFNQELLQANIKQNKQPISAIRDMMIELRSAWVEADSKVVTSSSDVQPALNITG